MNITIYSRQTGMSTLLISTILLFAISLITLFSTRSIVLQQKISANAYRSEQAFYNADAVINYLEAYLANDYPQATKDVQKISIDSKALSSLSADTNDLSELSSVVSRQHYIEVQGKGYSDDKSSVNQISQYVSVVPIAGNGSGKMVAFPLISRLGIEKNDHLYVRNHGSSNTIWSGGKVELGDSATYIPDPASIKLNHNKKIQLIQSSNPKSGNGIDIIERDYNLAKLTEQQYFENFLNESPSFIKRLAVDSSLYFSAANVQEVDGNNGVIWLADGDQSLILENVIIGKADKPVILIVDTSNNQFITRGDIIIHGLMYIRGDWHPTGQISVYGAVIVEGKIIKTENPELVNSQIYYHPDSLKPARPIANTVARVMGSWKDY